MLEKFAKAMKSLNEKRNKLYKWIVVAVGALNVSLLHIIGIIAAVIGAVAAILSPLLKTLELLRVGYVKRGRITYNQVNEYVFENFV